jgi:hypothetical protein
MMDPPRKSEGIDSLSPSLYSTLLLNFFYRKMSCYTLHPVLFVMIPLTEDDDQTGRALLLLIIICLTGHIPDASITYQT